MGCESFSTSHQHRCKFISVKTDRPQSTPDIIRKALFTPVKLKALFLISVFLTGCVTHRDDPSCKAHGIPIEMPP